MAAQSKGISKEIVDELKKEMPNIFFRKDIDRVLHGIFSRGTLAVLETRKVGPPVYYVGHRIAYTKETFIPWLEKYYNTKKEEQYEDIDDAIYRS